MKNKKISQITLILLLFSVVANLLSYFQTKYQLASPLIPKDIVYTIIETHMQSALVGSILSLIAILFYFFEKYLVSTIICVFSLLIQFYIHQYLPFQ